MTWCISLAIKAGQLNGRKARKLKRKGARKRKGGRGSGGGEARAISLNSQELEAKRKAAITSLKRREGGKKGVNFLSDKANKVLGALEVTSKDTE